MNGDRQEGLRRVFDVVVAASGLALAAPILAMVSAGSALFVGRPVLFWQTRPGRCGRPFRMCKLRTMNVLSEAEQAGVADEGRVTWWGRLLRQTSIDELPELWNVLVGDMSVVGPRPLLMRYYPYFTERERKRFDVKPGITGWAQVNGRSNLPWDRRLEMDVWYVEHRSLVLDARILVMTFLRVLQRRDVDVRPTEEFKYDLDVERQMKGAKANG